MWNGLRRCLSSSWQVKGHPTANSGYCQRIPAGGARETANERQSQPVTLSGHPAGSAETRKEDVIGLGL